MKSTKEGFMCGCAKKTLLGMIVVAIRGEREDLVAEYSQRILSNQDERTIFDNEFARSDGEIQALVRAEAVGLF